MTKHINIIYHPARRMGKTTGSAAATRDAEPSEIEAFYKRLRGMDKDSIIGEFNSRLDKAHLKSESKADLINAILNQRFSRRDLDRWGAADANSARDVSIMPGKTYKQLASECRRAAESDRAGRGRKPLPGRAHGEPDEQSFRSAAKLDCYGDWLERRAAVAPGKIVTAEDIAAMKAAVGDTMFTAKDAITIGKTYPIRGEPGLKVRVISRSPESTIHQSIYNVEVVEQLGRKYRTGEKLRIDYNQMVGDASPETTQKLEVLWKKMGPNVASIPFCIAAERELGIRYEVASEFWHVKVLTHDSIRDGEGEYGVRYRQANKSGSIQTKEKNFATQAQLDAFVKKVENEDGFIEFTAWLSPKTNDATRQFTVLISGSRSFKWRVYEGGYSVADGSGEPTAEAALNAAKAWAKANGGTVVSHKQMGHDAVNHLGEREYQTYAAWRAAAKAAGATSFEGDKDIAHAKGPNGHVGEWGGDVGVIYKTRDTKDAFWNLSDVKQAVRQKDKFQMRRIKRDLEKLREDLKARVIIRPAEQQQLRQINEELDLLVDGMTDQGVYDVSWEELFSSNDASLVAAAYDAPHLEKPGTFAKITYAEWYNLARTLEFTVKPSRWGASAYFEGYSAGEFVNNSSMGWLAKKPSTGDAADAELLRPGDIVVNAQRERVEIQAVRQVKNETWYKIRGDWVEGDRFGSSTSNALWRRYLGRETGTTDADRLVDTVYGTNKKGRNAHCKIYKQQEVDEYVCKLYLQQPSGNYMYLNKADYFSDDLADAKATAKLMVENAV